MQRSQFLWRYLVILLLVSAISASLVTRTFHLSFVHPTVQAHGVSAKHQHLDADALELTRPVPSIMFLASSAPHAPPAEPHFCSVEKTGSLYNRPPPSQSLL
jgi:hypothetical protein